MHLFYGALVSVISASWRHAHHDEMFVALYGPDRLRPFDRAAREIAPALSTCLGCGGCENLGFSPRALLVAARDLTALGLVDAHIQALASLDEGTLARLEQSCPAAIPFSRLATHLGSLGS